MLQSDGEWKYHRVLHLLQQKNSQRFGSGYHDYKVDDVKAQAPLNVGNQGFVGIYFIMEKLISILGSWGC